MRVIQLLTIFWRSGNFLALFCNQLSVIEKSSDCINKKLLVLQYDQMCQKKELVYCLKFPVYFPLTALTCSRFPAFFSTGRSNRNPAPLPFTTHLLIFSQQLHLEKNSYIQNTTLFNELSYSYATAIYPS